jgi:outer membrane protein TolC
MRAEISLSEIEREHATLGGESESALAELARILGEPASADHLMSMQINDLHTDKDEPPAALEQLYEIAVQARPDLSGRLAAIERDQIAEELAALRGKPNVSLGFIYQSMQKTNAIQPQTAMGVPNIGLFVGFNLPVYRAKIAAGVAEAQARTAADRALYEAEKNQSRRDIRTLHNSVKVQRQVLKLIQDTNLPNTRRILESVESDYRSGKAGVDVLSMLSAWRDVLAVELQIAQVETELAKSSASLERAVGMRLTQISPEELKSIKPSLPEQLPTLPPMSVTP